MHARRSSLALGLSIAGCLGSGAVAGAEPGRTAAEPRCAAVAGNLERSQDATSAQDRDVVPVSGRERLAWEFDAGPIGGGEPLRFVAYVDDVPALLTEVSCDTVGTGLARTCRSRLPLLTDGTHAIQVAAYAEQGGRRVEGVRSAPVRVRLSPPANPDADARSPRSIITSDGVDLHAELVATGLSDPTDLAMLPDGRILIAERSGRILQCGDGMMQASPAALLRDIATGEGRGLLALTVDPEFEKTRAVYAVYTATTGTRLVRLTDFGGGLGSAAVLLDGLPGAPSHPSAALRIGPDRQLFLALDDGGQPDRAGDLGSYEGKVLRLNRDGTTPRDQPRYSPVFLAGLNRPTGIAWQSGAAIWLVAADPSGDRLLSVVRDQRSGEAHIDLSLVLPPGVEGADVVFYDSPAIPAFRGSLLVAGGRGQALLRLRAGPDHSGPERLFHEALGPIEALAVGADGAIHALTADALWRIARR